MREKLQTLPLAQLRELAKAQGVKGITTLKKAELIDKLCELSEEQAGSQSMPKTEKEQTRTSDVQTPQNQEKTGTSDVQTPQNQEKTGTSDVQTPQSQEKTAESAEGSGVVEAARYRRETPVRREHRTANPRPRSEGQGESQPRSDSAVRGENSARSESSARGELQPHSESTVRNDRKNESQDRTESQPRSESQSRSENSYSSRPERSYNNGRSEEMKSDLQELDSGIEANGILEVMPDGFGFIRCENFLPGENDVYVAPSQIRRFNLKTGDIVRGSRRVKTATEKFAALLFINTINGYPTSVVERRPNFENLTPIFPNQRLHMEVPGIKNSPAMRVVDLLSPIGKGQRGMIVSPPKAGKTTLLKQVAKAVTTNHPDTHLIILLIDERPEEVTDIREAITGPNVEVIYSTFDELPDRHKRVSEMVIERAKRLVEHGRDVMILLDSITRLARAYNLVVPPSGRTLSGGLDPAALHMPKRFFGAARNMREGGSLTILATALIDTGSRMDDVIYEEFKGTGNMEVVLDRKLSEKRIFPAIDILKSGTRRDDLLLSPEEAEAVDIIHKATNSLKPEESVERILDLFSKTKNNWEFVEITRKRRFF